MKIYQSIMIFININPEMYLYLNIKNEEACFRKVELETLTSPSP